jgi:hypothetical protein
MAHWVLQVAPPQVYAPHGVVVCVHVPLPLQAPTLVCTPVAHDCAPHAAEAPG